MSGSLSGRLDVPYEVGLVPDHWKHSVTYGEVGLTVIDKSSGAARMTRRRQVSQATENNWALSE